MKNTINKGSQAGLKRGFTTGTSAAAGAKAAALMLFASLSNNKKIKDAMKEVAVTLPSGARLDIPVKSVKIDGKCAVATVVKYAGDDPDVTNGADIVTQVELLKKGSARTSIKIVGGKGVGFVTKPGLKIAPGRHAINPVPLKMIRTAVQEAANEFNLKPTVVVTVSVPNGVEIAKKTLNARLGIIGGISILGTSGIVEPMSLSAYTSSIKCAVDVALAEGGDTVVFTTGRSSEKSVMKRAALAGLPESAFVLTGDHMGYALKDAIGRKGLKKVIVAGQFGKFSKLAAGHFETHCSDSSVELGFLADLCKARGVETNLLDKIRNANTAREVFFLLKKSGLELILSDVCRLVQKNAKAILKGRIRVECMLAGYADDVVCAC